MRTRILTVVLGSLAAACAASEVDPEEGAAPASAHAAAAAPAGATAPGALPPADVAVTQLVLTGTLADGRALTLAVGRSHRGAGDYDHAILAVGGEVQVIDGHPGALRLAGLDSPAEVSWGSVEVEGNVRAVFGLALRRHAGAFGDRVFVEGTGTVGEVDVEVTGVLAELPEAADVLLAVAPPSDPGEDDAFALVALAADAEIVVAEGTVGGELVPSYAIERIAATDVVDARPGLTRELVEVGVNGRVLLGVHQYTPECGQ